MVYDQVDASVSLYVDGIEASSRNWTTTSSLGKLVIGSQSETDSNIAAFHGFVDNAFIYNTALSIDEMDFLRSVHYFSHSSTLSLRNMSTGSLATETDKPTTHQSLGMPVPASICATASA